MERLGGILIFAGLASGALQAIGYELRLLVWVDTWGPGPAWGIRGALVVVGAALLLLGVRRSSAPQGLHGQAGYQGPTGFPQGQPGFPPQGQQGYPPQGQQAYPQGYPPQAQQAYPQGYPPQGQPGYPPGPAQQGPPLQWVPQDDGTVIIPGNSGVGLQFTPKTSDGGPPAPSR